MLLNKLILYLKLLLLFIINLIICEDIFCGSLTIYKQQWLAKATLTIASQTTKDLKECLNICCSIPNCNAVTFMGFISTNSNDMSSTNCMMFNCRDKCVVIDRPIATEGVISVIINRTNFIQQTTTVGSILPNLSNELDDNTVSNSSPSNAIPLSFPRPPIHLTSSPPSSNIQLTTTDYISTSNTTTYSSTHHFLSQYTPIWAVGIAIVIAVVCIGINVVLVSAFCCYKRHKNRMRSENFTHVKAPTLHAFNPTT